MELRDINMELDASTPLLHETTVRASRKEVTKSRKGGTRTNYYVTLQSLPQSDRKTELEVSGCFYRSVKRGTEVVLTVRHGHLGYTWYESLQHKKNPDIC